MVLKSFVSAYGVIVRFVVKKGKVHFILTEN